MYKNLSSKLSVALKLVSKSLSWNSTSLVTKLAVITTTGVALSMLQGEMAGASSFSLIQTFPNPTPPNLDRFGISISTSDTNLLIGAPDNSTGATNAGVAYLYNFNTSNGTVGSLLQTFLNPTPTSGDNFGFSVSISGNNAVIGAPNHDPGATNAGVAYLFDGTTGNLLQTFHNPSPASGDNFGNSVAIDGNHVLIGAVLDDTGASSGGAAYLFDGTTGNLLQTFHNPSPASGDHFGKSVAIDGNYVLIGAALDDTGASDGGAAYLFNGTTGNLLQTFHNPIPTSGDNFGESVSISLDGTLALVGAPFEDTVVNDGGAAYLFNGTTGNLLQTFHNPIPAGPGNFGNSVSISPNGSSILIGATFIGPSHLYQQVPESSPILALLVLGAFGGGSLALRKSFEKD